MKNVTFLLIIFAIFSGDLFAQECECLVNGKKADFVYRSNSQASTCIMFLDKDSKFYLCRGCDSKKMVALPFPKSESTDDLVVWAKENSKSSKLLPEEALLIREGFVQWKVAQKSLGFTFTASGLGYKIDKQGTGKLPEKGKKVSVHYKGYLDDGTEFDNSFKRGQPIEFELGVGRVIKGWDEGIQLFKVGSKGTLKIPSELGYGKNGAGNVIPPNATLFFDIEVVNAD